MAKRLDLTGQRFGKLVAIAPGERDGKRTTWRCRCDCGKEFTALTYDLSCGRRKSCGCWTEVKVDFAGQRVGELTVLGRAPNIGRCSAWHCRCACGEELVLKRADLNNYRKCPHVHYPETLYAAVFGVKLKNIRCAWNKPDDWEAGFDHALSELSERERTVLLMRFKDEQTLIQCGNVFSITTERVRQIEVKALRRLKLPSRARYIQYGFSVAERQTRELEERANALRRKAEAEREKEKLRVQEEKERAERLEAEMLADIGDTPVERLRLSARSANALRRSGVRTLADLRQLDQDGLCRIRGLGNRSVCEISSMLRNEYALNLA